MPAVGEVSFELERFEWTADDRLEVVGRWNGVRGRRISRPALTVDAGGRRQRLSGTQESEEPWTASFAWSGDTLCFRSATATRHLTLVRAGRIQVVSLEQSPFDRRWGMAGIRVDTAGAAAGGHHVHIRCLADSVAEALYARLRRAAAP